VPEPLIRERKQLGIEQKEKWMATGKIKTLVTDRGFGFIEVEGGSSEVFFHSSSLADGGYDTLQVGQTVSFDVEADPRNPRRNRAANVKVGS
jgi:CspA family cold shock protein